MAQGPEAGLDLLERLSLDDYYRFIAARADLLRRLDRRAEAEAAYRRARRLCTNAVDARYLDRRLAATPPGRVVVLTAAAVHLAKRK